MELDRKVKKESQELTIRPYARLLSMLGDQLIKNEVVALTELVKNAYDADAECCVVSFRNFSEEYLSDENSFIEVSDDGFGMSYDVITTHFLNPATPIKKSGKVLRHSKKGRVCQGEKGIGRFSMLKLGKKVTVFSKEPEIDIVHCIVFDFEAYDNEFLTLNQLESEIFLDELRITYTALRVNDMPADSLLSEKGHGTIIRIENLKGQWERNKVDLLKDDFVKFSPLEIEKKEISLNKDFSIRIFRNGTEDTFYDDAILSLRNIILDKALYEIYGRYNQEEKKLEFFYSEAKGKRKEIVVSLAKYSEPMNSYEAKLWGLQYYKKEIEHFFHNNNSTICGSFRFEFYIFDFAANASEAFGLNRSEKEIIRNHRVFLYRDNVRVQPYGAPNDDWLQIDRRRATTRANEMFSNDQLFGQIGISKEENQNLRDKTSREGIIEDNIAFEQLIAIVRVFLSLVRTSLYQNYRQKKQQKKDLAEVKRSAGINKYIGKLTDIVKDNREGQRYVALLRESVEFQKAIYEKRLDTAESLAGVGLSVEVASHDIMLTMDRLKDKLRDIKMDVASPLTIQEKQNELVENAESAEEMFALIYMKMKDLQQIFVSSKQRPKLTRVESIIKKIQDIYARAYANQRISVEYKYIGNSPVVAKLIDAVLYQVFINLFDNALYWLQLIDGERRVIITLVSPE